MCCRGLSNGCHYAGCAKKATSIADRKPNPSRPSTDEIINAKIDVLTHISHLSHPDPSSTVDEEKSTSIRHDKHSEQVEEEERTEPSPATEEEQGQEGVDPTAYDDDEPRVLTIRNLTPNDTDLYSVTNPTLSQKPPGTNISLGQLPASDTSEQRMYGSHTSPRASSWSVDSDSDSDTWDDYAMVTPSTSSSSSSSSSSSPSSSPSSSSPSIPQTSPNHTNLPAPATRRTRNRSHDYKFLVTMVTLFTIVVLGIVTILYITGRRKNVNSRHPTAPS